MKEVKTNAVRKLESLKINFKEYHFDTETAVSGEEVAKILSLDADRVFKTLVTVGKSGNHYVFMVPVKKELDLKKAAVAVKEKNIEMIKSKELLTLTGYVHGGCSPVGMKKFFKTTVHDTAQHFDTIIFSGGKIGYQIELGLSELSKAIELNTADIIREEA
ncbi:MAG: Cys-tRNA(Pro) deacylase [Clostridia bacterium]|nr:Cys-tRNA(Pro) deacylase [Clostridia bacterium]